MSRERNAQPSSESSPEPRPPDRDRPPAGPLPQYTLSVREELRLDLPAALSLLRPSFPDNVYVQLGPRACSHWLNDFLAQPSARLVVARRASRMVGLAVFEPDTPAARAAGATRLLRRPGVLEEIASAALCRPAWLLRQSLALLQRARARRAIPESCSPGQDRTLPRKPAYWLNVIAVAPRARRTGVASRILEECLRLVAHAGGGSLKLATARDNAPAVRLYESLGFVRIGLTPDRSSIYARAIPD